MTTDRIRNVRQDINRKVADIRSAGPRLSPLDLHARMDEIRRLAADNDLPALESLARTSAQLALLPGHRVTMPCAFEHIDEAFDCRTDQDATAMLAALASRLH